MARAIDLLPQRLEKSMRAAPQRIALREIGETFVLPR